MQTAALSMHFEEVGEEEDEKEEEEEEERTKLRRSPCSRVN